MSEVPATTVTVEATGPVVVTETPAAAAAPAPAPSPVSPAITLWLEVAGAAATKGSAVRELVIGELTQQEIIKRKNAVLVLLHKYEEKTKELKKAEKSLVKAEFDINGVKTREYYEPESNVTLKKLRDEITTFSTALTAFFENNDTKKLYELTSKDAKDAKVDGKDNSAK
jgi:hypothetical protein